MTEWEKFKIAHIRKVQVFVALAFFFSTLATYTNPNLLLWQKFAWTAAGFWVSAFFCVLMENI